jgi:DNA-binding beta-propeller fold protein YncE
MAGVTVALIVLGTIGVSGVAEAVPGAVLWGKRYNGPGNGIDAARRMAMSPDGSKIYVSGSSVGATSGSDYATIAYNAATGSQVWVNRWSGAGSGADAVTAIALSPDGTKLYVTGSSVASTSGSDYATVAYNAATGALLWAKRYNGPGNGYDEARAVAVSPDGTKISVSGRSIGSTTDLDYATIAYNATSGAVIWTKRYNGPGNRTDDASAVVVSADGTKVYVSGSSEASSSFIDYATIAYNATTGAVIWTKRYNGPGNFIDQVSAMRLSPDGIKVYVTGSSTGPHSIAEDGRSDYATIAYNATTGALVWVKRYNGPANGDDMPGAIAVSGDGTKVYVTGGSPSTNATCVNCDDYATLAYNAMTGAVVWTMRYNGPANNADSAASVAVSPNGTKVYVTGQSVGSTGTYNYATVAYNAATGAFGWAKRYDGPGNGADDASGVVVSPDSSKIYVTGDSFGSTSNSDYATFAYSAT